MRISKLKWYANTITDIAKMSTEYRDDDIASSMNGAIINLSNALDAVLNMMNDNNTTIEYED